MFVKYHLSPEFCDRHFFLSQTVLSKKSCLPLPNDIILPWNPKSAGAPHTEIHRIFLQSNCLRGLFNNGQNRTSEALMSRASEKRT